MRWTNECRNSLSLIRSFSNPPALNMKKIFEEKVFSFVFCESCVGAFVILGTKEKRIANTCDNLGEGDFVICNSCFCCER